MNNQQRHTATRHRVPASGAALAVSLALVAAAACGTDDNRQQAAAQGGRSTVECAAGAVTGAGSTFVQTIVQQWIKDFGGRCPGASVNYQGVGSGAGIQQLIAGTVDFGASDVVMKPEEKAAARAKGGDVMQIPWSAGAVAVMYNLPGVKALQMSPGTLAAVYSGNVKRWDDPALAGDNPGVTLPAETIQVVHRSDGSGTTNVFTSYLADTAPTVWRAGSGKDVPWPAGQGAKGSDGVTAVVERTMGAIGYAELSFAASNQLGTVRLKNPAGAYVGPSAEGVSAALAQAEVPDDLEVKVTYRPSDPAAYPLSTVTWALVYAKAVQPAKGAVLRAFLAYALGPGQDAATGLYYAPLPAGLREKAQAAVATMTA